MFEHLILLFYFIFLFQFWSAYVPCNSQFLDSVQLTLEQIDLIWRLIEKYPGHTLLATSAEGKL